MRTSRIELGFNDARALSAYTWQDKSQVFRLIIKHRQHDMRLPTWGMPTWKIAQTAALLITDATAFRLRWRRRS